VDADVVLVPNWYEVAVQKKKEMDRDGWFVFTASVNDKFFGRMDSGNHFYNGRHVDRALLILRTLTKHMLRPESKIRHYAGERHAFFSDVLIGYHGYEQFFSDIFYRFWLHAKRSRKLEKKHPFLTGYAHEAHESEIEDKDYLVAHKGWEAGREGMVLNWLRSKLPILFNRMRSDASLRDTLFSRYLSEVHEKAPLSCSLQSFMPIVVDP
jgi:hypothetical protein